MSHTIYQLQPQLPRSLKIYAIYAKARVKQPKVLYFRSSEYRLFLNHSTVQCLQSPVPAKKIALTACARDFPELIQGEPSVSNTNVEAEKAFRVNLGFQGCRNFQLQPLSDTLARNPCHDDT